MGCRSPSRRGGLADSRSKKLPDRHGHGRYLDIAEIEIEIVSPTVTIAAASSLLRDSGDQGGGEGDEMRGGIDEQWSRLDGRYEMTRGSIMRVRQTGAQCD